MELYEVLLKANEKQVQGHLFSTEEQAKITGFFLRHASEPAQSGRTMEGVAQRWMYPYFYIPPFNGGKKWRLVTGELPKTHILSANHYELEILRLLALFGRGNEQVEEMLRDTEKRLEKTCFAHFCGKGECAGATISFLRFWSAYQPEDRARLCELLSRFGEVRDGSGEWHRGIDIPIYYYRYMLSELDPDLAMNEIEMEARREPLLGLLERGWIVSNSGVDSYSVMRKYVVRNMLARLPGFEYLKDAEVTIGENGRCYCRIPEALSQ